MDKETIINIFGGALGAWFIFSWIVHFLCYYFLEMIYNKDPFPFVIPRFSWFSPYSKPVKRKHEWIKWLTDFTLKMMGISFVLVLLFSLLVMLFTGAT